jgi:NADH-quinone oxidoreductase subunit A
MQGYTAIILLIVIAVALAFLLNNLSRLLGPLRPSAVNKLLPYESGMDPVGTAHERFSVKFYLVAMLFILFDIEVVFMYPWAVQYGQLLGGEGGLAFTLFPFLEMLVFVVILFVGYIYIYKKKGLAWS